jgi:membrane protein
VTTTTRGNVVADMNFATRLIDKADNLQQSYPWLAVPFATVKKFGDDQAGNLAALIAYYAFGAIFPLLLVLVTILDLVVRNNEKLREQLLNSALSQYPVVGEQLKSSVEGGINKTGIALVIGILLTLYSSLAVGAAFQNALNTAWGVPLYRRPRFPWSLARSAGLILILGPGQLASITLSSVAGGTGNVSGAGARAGAVAVSLVLNVGLFWLGFRVATASQVAMRDLRLGAILSAITWQLLQLLGGYFVGHQLKTHSAYGVFAIVLGLLAWLYLQAQITLYVVELNVVRVRKLWPRALAPPPLTAADMRTYETQIKTSQRRPELRIDVREAPPDPPAPGASGSAKHEV